MKTRATVVAAKKGYPFTGAESMQSLASDISSARLVDQRAISVLDRAAGAEGVGQVERAAMQHAASTLRRVNVAMTPVTRNRHVFEKPVTSVAIECFFSIMKSNQSAKRPNLADATTAAIVKAQNLTDPVVDPMAPTTPTIDWGKALGHELPPNMQV